MWISLNEPYPYIFFTETKRSFVLDVRLKSFGLILMGKSDIQRMMSLTLNGAQFNIDKTVDNDISAHVDVMCVSDWIPVTGDTGGISM